MGEFKTLRRIKFDYGKSLVIAIALPIGLLICWYYGYPRTLNEFLLLTHKTHTASGLITKAEEIEDYIETNNDRKIERTLDFNFEYSFKLPNGSTITSYGSETGALPEELLQVADKPFSVSIEYLPSNPETNRVMTEWTGEKSLFQWFRRRFIIGFILFLFFCYWGYWVFKEGRRNYKLHTEENRRAIEEYRRLLTTNARK